MILINLKRIFFLATPGRLVDHLENMKGFSLKAIKYLVIMISQYVLAFYLFILTVKT